MPWAFTICTDDKALDPSLITTQKIDKLIAKKFKNKLKFIDGETINGIFSIPKYHRTLMAKNKQIIRKNKPMFFTTSYSKRNNVS